MTEPSSKPTIYIGPSVWRNIEMMTVDSLIRLCLHLGSNGYKFYWRPEFGDADIARSRSKVATQFLQSDADVLLIFDSDIQFMPQDAMRICEKAIEKQSIVGGVFVKRGGDHDPALPLPMNMDIAFQPGSDIIECDYVSTGFAAVHRSVFQAMVDNGIELLHPGPAQFYPFYHHNPGYEEFGGHPIWMSEDWAMCSNAKALGFQCWMDPSFRLNHWGLRDYRLEDMLVRRPEPQPLLIGRHLDEETQKLYYRVRAPKEEQPSTQQSLPQSKMSSTPTTDSELSSIHRTTSSATASDKPVNGNRPSRKRSKTTSSPAGHS